MKTAFHYDPDYSQHTISGHPEHAGRLEAIYHYLQEGKLLNDLLTIDKRHATTEELLSVHSRSYLDLMARTTELTSPTMLGPDTYILPVSYDLARRAVGATLNAVDMVMGEEAKNALLCVRPPGHHATPSQAMGFCLLSTIAIAAQYARNSHGAKRVAIVDFDVHHGNGTQDALYDDEHILFISSHQSPLYPGTGQINEIGSGQGRGATINIPLRPGTGDTGIQQVYEALVLPALRRFQPDLILISAGFDAHWRDPLANLQLSLTGFAQLSQMLKAAAEDLCAGRMIAVTEGGYDLDALRYGVGNLLRILKDQAEQVEDPLGKMKGDQSVASLIAQIKSLHDL